MLRVFERDKLAVSSTIPVRGLWNAFHKYCSKRKLLKLPDNQNLDSDFPWAITCRLLLCQADRSMVMRSPYSGAALYPLLWIMIPNQTLSLSLSLSLSHLRQLANMRARENPDSQSVDSIRMIAC